MKYLASLLITILIMTIPWFYVMPIITSEPWRKIATMSFALLTSFGFAAIGILLGMMSDKWSNDGKISG